MLHRVRIRDVRGYGEHFPPARLHQRFACLKQGVRPASANRDRTGGVDETLRAGKAKPLARSRDQRNLALEANVHGRPAQARTRALSTVLKVRAAVSVTITVSLTATVNRLYSRRVIGTWKIIPGSSGTSTPRNRLRMLPSPQSGAKEMPML